MLSSVYNPEKQREEETYYDNNQKAFIYISALLKRDQHLYKDLSTLHYTLDIAITYIDINCIDIVRMFTFKWNTMFISYEMNKIMLI